MLGINLSLSCSLASFSSELVILHLTSLARLLLSEVEKWRANASEVELNEPFATDSNSGE